MAPELVQGLLLSLLAGLATTVGAAIAFVIGRFSSKALSLLLGFSAGVMLAVSFMELYAGAAESVGMLHASIAFFVGFGLIFVIDVLVPHEYQTEDTSDPSVRLRRAGMLTALGIAIHNFPEGLVVLSGAASSGELAVVLTVAIAVHNIPEGIAVAVPIVAATGKRREAFVYSVLSGLAEPLGAVAGALVLMHFMTPGVIAALLAGVAGLMVFISLDELLPAAHEYGQAHAATIGVLAGMAVMVGTLLALKG